MTQRSFHDLTPNSLYCSIPSTHLCTGHFRNTIHNFHNKPNFLMAKASLSIYRSFSELQLPSLKFFTRQIPRRLPNLRSARACLKLSSTISSSSRAIYLCTLYRLPLSSDYTETEMFVQLSCHQAGFIRTRIIQYLGTKHMICICSNESKNPHLNIIIKYISSVHVIYIVFDRIYIKFGLKF